ncbi:helix-turn-helix domain-containing protein [Aureimonas sp. AU40]|uniref:helix-turn-helix domain-containing protein n=1 Tax=Aureimonas sp. AU40 TaxID=1637747 RepID=UPI000785EF2C
MAQGLGSGAGQGGAVRGLLRAGEPIAEIAAACSFGDQSHLTRVFKSETGLTPAAYRAASRV